MKSLAGPYVFCSLDTARSLLRPPGDYVTFILVRCHKEEDAPIVVEKLQAYHSKIAAFTAEDFSFRSRWHWLTKTKAGIALGLAALLGLLVGGVVTYQTLRSATVASFKEYAVLRALGIPRWRMAMTVFAQSFWVGLVGVILAIPAIYGLAEFGNNVGAKVILPWQLMATAVGVTMITAMLSGALALRSLRSLEPVTLLR
jgi:putative ABC transport system permease protein